VEWPLECLEYPHEHLEWLHEYLAYPPEHLEGPLDTRIALTGTWSHTSRSGRESGKQLGERGLPHPQRYSK
jgi:hypothetical protein